MALTVTPGGASDDSLLSLADFETICADYGMVSTASDEAKEQSLRRMTIWVEGLGSRGRTVSYRWPGTRTSATQSRVFPRTGATRGDGSAIDNSAIPTEVELAVAHATVYDLANPGVLQAAVSNPAELYLKSWKLGEMEEHYAVDYTQPWESNRPILPIVLDILSEILVLERAGKSSNLFTAGAGNVSWE